MKDTDDKTPMASNMLAQAESDPRPRLSLFLKTLKSLSFSNPTELKSLLGRFESFSSLVSAFLWENQRNVAGGESGNIKAKTTI